MPIYLQLMEQVKHAIETGALRPGEQLPGIRPLAEELVINPNTVAKAYRELEHEGVDRAAAGRRRVRVGEGAVEEGRREAARGAGRGRRRRSKSCAPRGVADEDIRRLFEAELSAGNELHARHGGKRGE